MSCHRVAETRQNPRNPFFFSFPFLVFRQPQFSRYVCFCPMKYFLQSCYSDHATTHDVGGPERLHIPIRALGYANAAFRQIHAPSEYRSQRGCNRPLVRKTCRGFAASVCVRRLSMKTAPLRIRPRTNLYRKKKHDCRSPELQVAEEGLEHHARLFSTRRDEHGCLKLSNGVVYFRQIIHEYLWGHVEGDELSDEIAALFNCRNSAMLMPRSHCVRKCTAASLTMKALMTL